MPAKPQSWKKIIDQRRKENFVGRGDQLRVFSDNFVGDVPDCMVFAVTGEGGVGKSALLTQYEAIARSASINANVIICDDRHLSPASAMGYIAGELAKIGVVHKGFDERYKKYRDMRQEIEGDAKAPRSWVNMLAYGVSDLTIKSLRKAPGVGVLFEYADEKAAGEAFAELVNYGINRWGNKDEVQLLREPEIILAPLFLELLNDACARQPLVLMFDVFERTCETLSPWLMALFDFEYGEFTTRLTFVVSGRDPLEQHWTELAGALCRVPLEPFTLEETRLYLSNQDITGRTAGRTDSRRHRWPAGVGRAACRHQTAARRAAARHQQRCGGALPAMDSARGTPAGSVAGGCAPAVQPGHPQRGVRQRCHRPCSTGSRHKAIFAPTPNAAASITKKYAN